jgi:threonine/homoserine/homoserine lactone efflux protein
MVLVLVIVIVVLSTLVLDSWRRHLRWEERRMKWRMRIFGHTIIFCALMAALIYLLIRH